MWVHGHAHPELYTSCIKRNAYMDRHRHTDLRIYGIIQSFAQRQYPLSICKSKNRDERREMRVTTDTQHTYTLSSLSIYCAPAICWSSSHRKISPHTHTHTSQTDTETQALSEEPLGILQGPISKPKRNCFSVERQPMVGKKRSIIYNRREKKLEENNLNAPNLGSG